MYPILCEKHSEPCIECHICRTWGKAFHQWQDSFKIPPSQHPASLRIQATEWANKTFPTITHSLEVEHESHDS